MAFYVILHIQDVKKSINKEKGVRRKMSTAIKYFVLGFRNAFTPIQVKMTKSLGQISSEIFEKRRVLIEQVKDRRKTSTNKK